VSLIETNPAFCAGWGHNAAFPGAYAAFLLRIAGELPLDPAGRRALAERLGCDLRPEGVLFGWV
jgi:hypothetical protein